MVFQRYWLSWLLFQGVFKGRWPAWSRCCRSSCIVYAVFLLCCSTCWTIITSHTCFCVRFRFCCPHGYFCVEQTKAVQGVESQIISKPQLFHVCVSPSLLYFRRACVFSRCWTTVVKHLMFAFQGLWPSCWAGLVDIAELGLLNSPKVLPHRTDWNMLILIIEHALFLKGSGQP